MRVKSYPDFKNLLDDYVTKNAAPVSFIVNHSLDQADYSMILYDLRFSNSRLGRRDKIKNPRPGLPVSDRLFLPRGYESCLQSLWPSLEGHYAFTTRLWGLHESETIG